MAPFGHGIDGGMPLDVDPATSAEWCRVRECIAGLRADTADIVEVEATFPGAVTGWGATKEALADALPQETYRRFIEPLRATKIVTAPETDELILQADSPD